MRYWSIKINVPTNLSNLKSKVDELDFDQLVPVPVDLSKLSDVVKNDAVKKDVYNPEKKNIEDKITDFINLVIKTTLNAKIKEVKGEILSITNLASKTSLTAIKSKIPNVSNWLKKMTTTQNLVKLERKLLILIMVNILLL